MDYNHITSFLDKFKIILFKKEETNNVVIQTISNEIHHTLDNSSVKIKKGYIYVEGSPILRNEVLFKKKQILMKLKILLPDINFLDIR
jgi:hypothetical protein